MEISIPTLKPEVQDRYHSDTEAAFDFLSDQDRPNPFEAQLNEQSEAPKKKGPNDPFRQVRLVCEKLKGKEIKDKKVLSDLVAVLNQRNKNGRTPLMLASSIGDIQLIIELIETGAIASLVCPKGKTALHYAARTGQLDACRVLLGAGVNISAQDLNHAEPLYDAIMGEHPDGVTAIDLARQRKAKVILQFIIQMIS